MAATVNELSEPYAVFMRTPLAPGSGEVCQVCLRFHDGRYPTCYKCGHRPQHADAVLPISYTGKDGQLYNALAQYKRHWDRQAARQLGLQLAAVLWRFLLSHERCLARAAGAGEAFDLVTVVPSSEAARDEGHPLHGIVGRTVALTRDRYERLLTRSAVEADKRSVEPTKFAPSRTLDGESVLLVDDTWVTGGSVQSAAGALKSAGAGPVGVLVIARLIDEDYGDNQDRLKKLPKPFDWTTCALHHVA
jgi:predicted amidophosphoribosyltransferase